VKTLLCCVLFVLSTAPVSRAEIIIRLKDGRSVSVAVNKDDVEAILFTNGSGGGPGSTTMLPAGKTPQNSNGSRPPSVVSQQTASGTVRILSGRFGAAGKYCDAGPKLKAVCDGTAGCEARADGSWCGDPNMGVVKELEVQYSCGAAASVLRAKENDTIQIRCK
jgi:hypothetical protein